MLMNNRDSAWKKWYGDLEVQIYGGQSPGNKPVSGVFLKSLDLSGNGDLLSNDNGGISFSCLQPGCLCHGIHTDTRYPSLSVREWIIFKSSTPQCLSSVYSKPRCCGKGKVHVRRQTSRDAFFPLSTILMEGTNLWNSYQLSSQSQSVVGVALGCLVWRLGTACPGTVSKNKPFKLLL